MQNIPLPAWQQISIVIVYSILALGLGLGLLRIAERAFTTTTHAFGNQLAASNRQWQQYFDDRTASLTATNQEILALLRALQQALAPAATTISLRKHIKGAKNGA